MTKTMDQVRAADALGKVKKLSDEAKGNSAYVDRNDKYAIYAKSLPATILMNGLGQAATSLLAKAEGSDAHKLLYMHLESWLCKGNSEVKAPYLGHDDLIEAIIGNSRESYLRAQAEALAWLAWLKKFAVAYLKKTDGGGNDASPVQD